MTIPRLFFPSTQDEPYSGPLSDNAKTFFDVHMDKLSQETREALLRYMVDHNLGKQDAGIVFASVLLAVERIVADIPYKSHEAIDMAGKMMVEILSEQALRLFALNADQLDALSKRLTSESEQAMRKIVAEKGLELEKRVLPVLRHNFDKSLAAFSSSVAKETRKAVKEALSTELSTARDEIERMTSAAREARDTIKWLPWWTFFLVLVCGILIGGTIVRMLGG